MSFSSAPAPTASAQLRLHLFGQFRLETQSRMIRIPTRKVESLLAYLVLNPQLQAREKLAALFWGDMPDAHARHSLRTALAILRKALGAAFLIADRTTVQLNPDQPLWVDALVFQVRAKEFLSADPPDVSLINFDKYEGDLLTDFNDDWITTERHSLRLLYLDALLHFIAHLRSKAEYSLAIEHTKKVLAIDPANETAHLHLMFCFAAIGDRLAALKQYDECVRILREELAVAPSSETTALRDQIMQELTGAQAPAAAFTNLPTPLTGFIGRQRELGELRELITNNRLVTLTGPGGCGKTRLAIQVGSELASARRFKHGVWWVELASLNDPALVPQSIASVFDLRESVNAPLIMLLSNFLREKELLLVFDNCEHLIDACAQLAHTLLSACPTLRILATSREALGIIGEEARPVPSLAVPNIDQLPPLDLLAQYDSIQLFVQRARAVAPNWKLGGNASAVARICVRLDGIPLAIELAAARVRGLQVQEIANRLDSRFQLLTVGSRTALPRQQTLRAAIDWSFDLISDRERILFWRLAAFEGGWTLEAAEEICAVNPISGQDVMDLLLKLIAKSLVLVDERSDIARYRFLETIRQYASEKLVDSGEEKQARDRHLDHFVRLAAQAEPFLLGSLQQIAWFRRLEADYDNLRAAIHWSLHSGDPVVGMRLASALLWFWGARNHLNEAREWLTELLANSASMPDVLRAKGLQALSWSASFTDDFNAVREPAEASLALFRTLDHKVGMAWSLIVLGVLSRSQDDLVLAHQLLMESLTLGRETNDKAIALWSIFHLAWVAFYRSAHMEAQSLFAESVALGKAVGDSWAVVNSIGGLGDIAWSRGDYTTAHRYFEEFLALSREVGEKGAVAEALTKLGEVDRIQGHLEVAIRCQRESLVIGLEKTNGLGLPYTLESFAKLAFDMGKSECATRLFGAAEVLLEATGSRRPAASREAQAIIVEAVHRHFADADFVKLWAEGRAMTQEQAAKYALETVT